MTHHVLPAVDRAAFAPFRHAFLIREPRGLLASYARVRSAPTVDDLGLRQQAEIFGEFGGPVIDSADLLAAPEAALRALCARARRAVLRGDAVLAAGAASDTTACGRRTGTTACGGRPGSSRSLAGPPAALDPALEPLLERVPALLREAQRNKIKIDIPNDSG